MRHPLGSATASRPVAGAWCAAHRRALRSDARVHRLPDAVRLAHRAPPGRRPPGRRRAPRSATPTRVQVHHRAPPDFGRQSPPPNAPGLRRVAAAVRFRHRRARPLRRLLERRPRVPRRGGTRSLATAAPVAPPHGCAGRQGRSAECFRSHRRTTQCGAARSRLRGRGQRCHRGEQSHRDRQRAKQPHSRGQEPASSPRRA